MTITIPKQRATKVDDFIAAAPDAASETPAALVSPGLKSKRGIARSQVSVVLPDAVLVKFDAEAARRYMSRSALITSLINQFLEQGQS
jgi:hypothetical protein